ncbi:aminotransferase class I/II-fold pyridoxal phosphate-dependent enzyme, partial [Bacillus safensis]
YLPNLSSIDPEVLKKAKVLFLNYPNNPTGAVANDAFFEEAADFASA